jgi:hypothetical protein
MCVLAASWVLLAGHAGYLVLAGWGGSVGVAQPTLTTRRLCRPHC